MLGNLTFDREDDMGGIATGTRHCRDNDAERCYLPYREDLTSTSSIKLLQQPIQSRHCQHPDLASYLLHVDAEVPATC